MYTTSAEYKAAMYGQVRIVRAAATLGGVSIKDDDNLQSITIDRPCVGEHLIGSALSAKISIKALDPAGELSGIEDGAALSVSLGVEKDDTGALELIPFPSVTCDSVEYDPDSEVCTAYGFDDMTLLDGKTFSELEIVYPATLRQIAAAAAAKVGVSLSSDPFFMEGQSYTEEDKPNLSGRETLRQVMAWVAEAALSNAIIGRDGKIHFISIFPASPASTIDAKDYFEFEADSPLGAINTFVLGRLPQNDNVYREDPDAVALDGSKELRINDNPFLDGRRDLVIDQYFAKVNGLSITPYRLRWRGDPAIDPGDTLRAVDRMDNPVTVLYGNTTLDFNGGLSADTALEIKSLTETNKSTASSTVNKMRRTELQVDKVSGEITAVVQAVEDTQNYVNGAIERVTQENSAAIEISKGNILDTVEQIYTTKTETQTVREELSSSINQTAQDVEIRFAQAQESTQQVADDLLADKTERETYIRFDADGMELGKTDSKIVARLENDRLSFLESGREVAYISDSKLYITQAEILTDLQLGKFAYTPRNNGNLSLLWKG